MRFLEWRKINIEATLKIGILLGFALFFSYLIQSGRVQLYVNPRLVPSLKFGVLAMVLIALFTLREVFRPRRRARVAPYFFFIVPLILAFSLPAQSMNSASMPLGDIAIGRQVKGLPAAVVPRGTEGDYTDESGQNDKKKSLSSDNPGAVEVNSSNYEALASLATSPADRRLKLQDNMVIVDDGNYFRWLKEIYDNQEIYRGKKIQMVGFVFRGKQVKGNEFVPARLLMICCTADLQVVGMLCRYDKAKSLAGDSWVKVTGTIRIITYKGTKVPIVVADSVVETDTPKSEYVYPF